ncbi:MAG: c-type cytochrome [Syntrophorhabdaceae bacterium]
MNNRAVFPGIFLFLLAFVFSSVVSCDYARMREQESVKTYEKEMPSMDTRTIPTGNSFQALRTARPKTLRNPFPLDNRSVRQGRRAYTYHCIPCHGPKGDGMGTVGQSFAPLPTDLASRAVQNQSDGELYAKIRLGHRRHPELYTTISEPDTWAVIHYSRSLAGRK